MAIQFTQDVIVPTLQFEKAFEFYLSVMGMQLKEASDTAAVFTCGPMTLRLEKGPQTGAMLEYAVSDKHAMADYLAKKGCEVLRKEAGVVELRDPFGIRFRLRSS
jgi:predicted enzyme related to lactoylglutathione lyase